MGSTTMKLSAKGTFARGVHPHDEKSLAADVAIEVVPTPAKVSVPLLQHLGAQCEPLVKARQQVVLGEKIGESEAFISAPVHATITGTVAMSSVATLPNGRHVKTVPIKADEQQLSGDALFEDILGGDWPKTGLDRYGPDAIVTAVREAGIVGQGGAAFPTYVKLKLNDAKPVDTLLLNGCECEPYLTADYRLMLEAPDAIVCGALLAARACGAKRIIVAIEDNKPSAIETMLKAAEGTDMIVRSLKTKYPMGGEKQTVLAAIGREVPTGGLPLDVGAVVCNVGTSAAIARAVVRDKALTHRVLTVSGRGIRNPKNLLVPIGISYGELIDYCGGLTEDAARVIAGGPMMGFTLGELDTPVTKGTSGLTVLTRDDVRKADETACVHCGKCVDVCPLKLVAAKMALASKHGDWELARRYHITACMECGCCAYVCPASIPLVQLIRLGKAQMPKKITPRRTELRCGA